MRLQLLLGAAVSLFHLALGSTEDYINIEKITNDFNIYADDKNFSALGALFAPNGTYDAGDGPKQDVKGTLSTILSPGTVTRFDLTTQRIVLDPPFDALGAAEKATTLTYVTVTFFGTGKLKGKFYTFVGRYTDTLIKTGNFEEYGGWRFNSRAFRLQVSFFFSYDLRGEAGLRRDWERDTIISDFF